MISKVNVGYDPFIQRLLIYMVIREIVIFNDHHIRQCTCTSSKHSYCCAWEAGNEVIKDSDMIWWIINVCIFGSCSLLHTSEWTCKALDKWLYFPSIYHFVSFLQPDCVAFPWHNNSFGVIHYFELYAIIFRLNYLILHFR